MQIADRFASWKISSGTGNRVLQMLSLFPRRVTQPESELLCVFSHRGNVFTELFPSNGCCAVACYLAVGLNSYYFQTEPPGVLAFQWNGDLMHKRGPVDGLSVDPVAANGVSEATPFFCAWYHGELCTAACQYKGRLYKMHVRHSFMVLNVNVTVISLSVGVYCVPQGQITHPPTDIIGQVVTARNWTRDEITFTILGVFLGAKGRPASKADTSPPSVSRLSRENVRASTSHNPMGLHVLFTGIALPFL
jgi:hypothetical protein